VYNEFRINLKDENAAKRISQQRAMHIMASLFLMIFGLQFFLQSDIDWNAVLLYLMPAVGIFSISLFKKSMLLETNYNLLFRILETALLFSASMHYMQSNKVSISIVFGLIALMILCLFLFEHYYFSNQYVYINDKGVAVPHAFKRKNLEWKDIENVIIHTNTFTLEEKNDLLFQKGIELKIEDVSIINEFCSLYLKK
jgi:hypothetical protein